MLSGLLTASAVCQRSFNRTLVRVWLPFAIGRCVFGLLGSRFLVNSASYMALYCCGIAKCPGSARHPLQWTCRAHELYAWRSEDCGKGEIAFVAGESPWTIQTIHPKQSLKPIQPKRYKRETPTTLNPNMPYTMSCGKAEQRIFVLKQLGSRALGLRVIGLSG